MGFCPCSLTLVLTVVDAADLCIVLAPDLIHQLREAVWRLRRAGRHASVCGIHAFSCRRLRCSARRDPKSCSSFAMHARIPAALLWWPLGAVAVSWGSCGRLMMATGQPRSGQSGRAGFCRSYVAHEAVRGRAERAGREGCHVARSRREGWMRWMRWMETGGPGRRVQQRARWCSGRARRGLEARRDINRRWRKSADQSWLTCDKRQADNKGERQAHRLARTGQLAFLWVGIKACGSNARRVGSARWVLPLGLPSFLP
jgi:hypothetical protein